jgi:hypothetical protein
MQTGLAPAPASLTLDSFHKVVLVTVVVVFTAIKLVAHYRFGTSSDSALFGNVAWRLGNGLDSISTLTGFRYFATHASVVILLVAPVFRLLPSWGLPFTFVWQVVSVGLVGLGVSKAAAGFGICRSAQRLLLVSTMLAPGAFLAARLDVHEPTLGLGFLAMTLGAGLGGAPIRRSWWWPVLSAACRIEMAVATIVAGVLLLRSTKSRRMGELAVLAGSAGLLFCLWFVLRSGSEAASVAAHFSHLGSTVGEVIQTALTKPLEVIRPLAEPDMLVSILLWLLPWGLVMPIAGWRYLFVAAPMAGIAILGTWRPADLYPHHYWYGFLIAAPIAAAEALRRRPDRLRILAVTSAIGIAVGWAVLLPAMGALQPLGRVDSAVLREMVDYASGINTASVSAPDNVTPHLLGRMGLFAFPRPFLCSENSIGPFAWAGEPPDYVLLQGSDIPDIEDDPVVGSTLRSHYSRAAGPSRIAAYRLNSPTTGLMCSGP